MAKMQREVSILDLPDMSDRALDSLDEYLGAVEEQCRRATNRLRSQVRKGTDNYPAAAARYWAHVSSGVKWLRGQIRQTRAATGRPGGGRHGTTTDGAG